MVSRAAFQIPAAKGDADPPEGIGWLRERVAHSHRRTVSLRSSVPREPQRRSAAVARLVQRTTRLRDAQPPI